MAYAGQTVNLIAQINDYYNNQVNEGNVNFTVNNTNIGTIPVINGIAKTNWTIPLDYSTGNYTIQANYMGTSNYLASNNTSILTVDSYTNYNHHH